VVSTRGESGDREARGTKCVNSSRLADLKRQIESGEYETSEKLDATVARLIGDLKQASGRAKVSREGGSGGGRP
jgi:anti-sigma28 factor (negative regulator of flagellin synthesis)